MEGVESNQDLDVPQTTDSGETIMLQLEDAAHLVLHQQGDVEGEDTAEPSVTYQIIAQQMTDDGQMQLTLSDGVNIIQTTMATDQLHSLEANGAGIVLQESDSEETLAHIGQHGGESGSTQTSLQSQPNSQSEMLLQTDESADTHSVNMLDVLNNPVSVAKNEALENDLNNSVPVLSQAVLLGNAAVKDGINKQSSTDGNSTGVVNVVTSTIPSTGPVSSKETAETSKTGSSLKPKQDKVKLEKKPDLTKPIEVTDHMEVMVKGKKCLLQVNPETGQLCAYPLIMPGKKRGRPRRGEHAYKPGQPRPPDKIDSAAEGLLELSNTGPDGIRRSNRRNRGKPKTLTDYEVFEVSSDDDAAVDDGEDEVLPSGAIRKRKILVEKEYKPSPVLPVPGALKRARGRPRRYPCPEETQTTNQIPAMIIPSGDGQTIMMAPLQGVTNLEEFQDQLKNLAILQPGTFATDDGSQFLNLSGLMDSAGDGTMVSIQLENLPTETNPVLESASDLGNQSNITGMDDPLSENQGASTDLMEDETETKNISDAAADIVDDDTNMETEIKGNVDGVDSELAEAKTNITGNDALLTEGKEIPGEAPVLTDLSNNEETSDILTGGKSDVSQPTIIRIPENLLPMFIQKKEPVTLGLRASNLNLAKLKCSKCDFQAYYEQQYQDHIATHTADTLKCKCCKFVAFEREELVKHFKKNHPRCICSYCDHMAEQAYIIKRHTMRHTQEGCKCEICNKVYKDQYVLKMHVKMVHMPAEVLFECNICSKKFTRKAHLKRHLRIHNPEKPFKCPHQNCNYRGCEKSDISKHVLIHEEPKYVCEVCNKPFRHMKNKELHVKRHSGQRDYKCGVCDFYGYTFTDIRKHIERKHTDNKALVCDKCGSVFRTETAYREHRSQSCDTYMIEQALAIATSDGGTTQATIQIPSHFTVDTQQLIQVDGQRVSIDKDGQITVGQPDIPGEGTICLTEEQIQAVASGQLTEVDLQNLVTQNQLNVSELQATVSQGEVTTQEQNDGTMIQTINTDDRQLQTFYKGIPVEDTSNGLRSELLYKGEEDVTEGEETMDEEEDLENQMEGIVSDTDDKSGIVKDDMLAMVNMNIIR